MVEKAFLDELYSEFNGAQHAEQDPVRFPRMYEDVREREVTGLIAALLAYGRLARILKSVADVLDRLERAPRLCILSSSPEQLRAACSGFVHRTVDGDKLWRLLQAVKGVLEVHGSLEACFLKHDDRMERTILPGLSGLAAELAGRARVPGHLIADPTKGSACKRWNLYLRWMVRHDAVDPGGWQGVSASRLIVPLDTHMWRVCKELGLTRRKVCNLRAALDVTHSFRQIAPGDPVKYDFALMHASLAGRLDGRALADGRRSA
jgi:uncharacterized protein (TIGR02757 family)